MEFKGRQCSSYVHLLNTAYACNLKDPQRIRYKRQSGHTQRSGTQALGIRAILAMQGRLINIRQVVLRLRLINSACA